MRMIKVIPGQTGADYEACNVQYFGDNDTSTNGDDFIPCVASGINPKPAEIKIEIPKKPRPRCLVEAKQKEQLKVWGLRK